MEIIITPKALKQHKHLQKTDQAKIKKKLLSLNQNPFEGKRLSGEYQELYSLKAWPYRIIYYVDKENETIYIVTIAHRQGVYK